MPKAPPVDGLQSVPPKKKDNQPEIPEKVTKRLKQILIIFIFLPYIIYVLWGAFLLMVLPSPTGQFQQLLIPGVLSAAVAGLLFLFGGILALRRIIKKEVTNQVRVRSMIRVLLFAIPGFLLSIAIPLVIIREPPLTIAITDPTDQTQMIAPLSVSFSLEQTVGILERRGQRALNYTWDFDGDGLPNDTTIVPVAVARYERPGAYNVSVTIDVSDGSKRQVVRRVEIPKAVFSISPDSPGVEEPVYFSVEHLVEDLSMIVEVQWDFDGDGIIDTVSDLPDAAHTFIRTGMYTVSALVNLNNQTQREYERVLEIAQPEPSPFPVKIITEPEQLIGHAPFGTIFRIESEVPLEDVIWDFGDGERGRGERIGHNFQKRGVFQVTANISAADGQVAELAKLVRVVDQLQVASLRLEGTPTPNGDTLRGEVPVNVNLTPRTSTPLVDFTWEVPGATSVGSTQGTLQAIYRRAGNYQITLIGQDPDENVMRKTYTLVVDPPSKNVTIRMTPEGGVAPLLVRFDASETIIPGEEITGFEWSFGDQGSAQQRGAQVEYLFETPGTFQISLRTYTTSGNRYDENRTIVVRAPILDACGLPSRTAGEAPLGVSFDMSCTTGEPTEILWNFGDGSESDEGNPVHVFEEPGTYQVKLSIKDSLGSSSSTTISITAE